MIEDQNPIKNSGISLQLKIPCCLIVPNSGSVKIRWYHLIDKNDSMRVKKRIGSVPDIGLYESLDIVYDMKFYGQIYEYPEEAIDKNTEKYLKILELLDNGEDPIYTLSSGMKQRVAVARVLVHDVYRCFSFHHIWCQFWRVRILWYIKSTDCACQIKIAPTVPFYSYTLWAKLIWYR